MKVIQKLGVAKFQVTTPEISDGQLTLDFNPVIEEYNLQGKFALIHWQARPKGYREWGIYEAQTDTYRSSFDFPPAYGKMKMLMLDDKTASTIPSAVIYFVGAFVN